MSNLWRNGNLMLEFADQQSMISCFAKLYRIDEQVDATPYGDRHMIIGADLFKVPRYRSLLEEFENISVAVSPDEQTSSTSSDHDEEEEFIDLDYLAEKCGREIERLGRVIR